MPVLILRRSQIASAARLLADALHDDPSYTYVFPDPRARRAGLQQFFARHLANHAPHRCSYVHEPGAAVAATVTLRPPGGVRFASGALVWRTLGFAALCGPAALVRLLRAAQLYDGLAREAAGGRAYWHVHMMAVAPDLQGQGIGAQLLAAVLRERLTTPHPAVLTTHTQKNVRFYERAGFAVVAEHSVAPDGEHAYPVWCMRREPDLTLVR